MKNITPGSAWKPEKLVAVQSKMSREEEITGIS